MTDPRAVALAFALGVALTVALVAGLLVWSWWLRRRIRRRIATYRRAELLAGAGAPPPLLETLPPLRLVEVSVSVGLPCPVCDSVVPEPAPGEAVWCPYCHCDSPVLIPVEVDE